MPAIRPRGPSAVVASDHTYTSGSIVLSGGDNITVGTNGATVTISAANTVAQSLQTQNRFNLTLSGNTDGVMAQVSSGTLTLAGGNGITLSQAGNAITVSGVTQSVQTQGIGAFGVSTGGNTAGDTGAVTGRLVLAGGNGITLSGSTNGGSQTLTISGVTQSVQTQNRFNLTLSGNTDGVLAAISSGTLTLAGGNGITLSQAGNVVTISGVTQSVQPVGSFGISTGGNTAGDTGLVSGRLVLVGSNGITASGSTNGASMTVTLSGVTQSVQPVGSFGISTGGNTAGDTGLVTGRLVLVGSNGITASGSTNGASMTITLSGVTQSVQPVGTFGISTAGNTAGDTGLVSGRLVLVGSNGITASGSTNGASMTVTLSGVTQSIQTQSINTVGMSNIGNTAGDTATVTGRIIFAGGNNITLSGSTNGVSQTITIAALSTSAQMSLGVSTGGNTAGDTGLVTGRIVFVGSNGITASGSTNAGSMTITLSGVTQSIQTQSINTVGMSNIGNTAGDTATVTGRIIFAGGNNITLSGSTNGVSQTITIAALSTSAQLSVGISTGGNTAGDAALVTGRLVLVGSNGITASGSTNAGSMTITLSGVTVPAQLSVGNSTGGNTLGDTGVFTGRVVFVGGNNVTLSGASNGGSATITISGVPSQSNFSLGLSTGGNTAGDTGVTATRIVLVGTNNISLSQTTGANGATISINNTVSAFQAGVSTGGSTQGDTGVTGTRLVFVGTGGVVLSQATGANGGTISIDGQNKTMSSWFHNSAGLYSSTLFAHVDNSLSLAHIQIPQDISFSRVDWPVSVSMATAGNNSTAAMNLSAVYVLYTRNASTLTPIVGGSSTTTYTWVSSTGVYSSLTGPRVLSFPLATALTPGDYWMGVQLATVSNVVTVGGANTTALRATLSPINGTTYSVLPWQDMSASTAGTNNMLAPFQGVNSVSISNTTMTQQLTQMTHTNTHGIRANMVFIFRNV